MIFCISCNPNKREIVGSVSEQTIKQLRKIVWIFHFRKCRLQFYSLHRSVRRAYMHNGSFRSLCRAPAFFLLLVEGCGYVCSWMCTVYACMVYVCVYGMTFTTHSATIMKSFLSAKYKLKDNFHMSDWLYGACLSWCPATARFQHKPFGRNERRTFLYLALSLTITLSCWTLCHRRVTHSNFFLFRLHHFFNIICFSSS